MPTTPLPSIAPSPELVTAREQLIQLLTDRYADDTLSLEAFESRLDAMYRSTSEGELRAIAADLAAATSTPAATLRWGPERAPFPARPLRQRLVAFMAERHRVEQWAFPEQLDVRAIMSNVTVDLTAARLPAVVEIDVLAVMASVTIIVPADVVVEMDVLPVAASATDRTARDARAPVGLRHLRITGTAVLAEVRARQPRPRRAGRLPGPE